MHGAVGVHPKRSLSSADGMTLAARRALAERVTYGGNGEHKLHAADYGIAPPRVPRPSKTLCDAEGPFPHPKALALLKAGAAKGMVSEQLRRRLPQLIWAVADDGTAYESQLENSTLASYHGYPMPAADPLREHVLEEWRKR
jgi:hypothetical protein